MMHKIKQEKGVQVIQIYFCFLFRIERNTEKATIILKTCRVIM